MRRNSYFDKMFRPTEQRKSSLQNAASSFILALPILLTPNISLAAGDIATDLATSLAKRQ